jgi:hypothetical protein
LPTDRPQKKSPRDFGTSLSVSPLFLTWRSSRAKVSTAPAPKMEPLEIVGPRANRTPYEPLSKIAFNSRYGGLIAGKALG